MGASAERERGRDRRTDRARRSEPTNHLDLEAVIYLESVLSKWKKTLVVVSHDVDFLDQVVDEIMHLEDEKLYYYRGHFSQFEEQHKIHMEGRKKEWEKQQKQLKEQKSSKQRMTARERERDLKRTLREDKKKGGGGGARRGGGGGGGDDDDDDEGFAIAAAGKGRGEKEASQAALMARPREYVVRFQFPAPTELSPPIIQVRDVEFHYAGGPVLFKKLNFGIDMSSRVAVCGKNGTGKSTLIGLLTGSLSPTQGEVGFNRHVRIAAYKQHFVDALPLNETPIEYLHNKHNVPAQETRPLLGRYGLSGVAHTIKMAQLSVGQKARVVFADMALQKPHILILDEPSNNLDMESIRALGEAVNEFEGGVVMVTHDTRLIEETNMVLWVVERQTVLEQVGGIDQYRGEIIGAIEERERKEAERIAARQVVREAERAAKVAALEERHRRREAATAAGGKRARERG